MEEYAIRCAKWLENRVRKAESRDPKLRPLKDRINQLSDKLKSVREGENLELQREQDQAIEELLSHILRQSAP